MRRLQNRASAKTRLRWRVALVLIFLAFVPVEARGPLERERAAAGVRIYYAPQTNLAEIDRALMASAKRSIDFAAYVLSDRSIMTALIDAARRGVRIRIYLDPDQPASRDGDRTTPFWSLFREKNIEVRGKFAGRDIMHLKAYQVDGRVLRTGSSNFSWSGARRQDNDLVLIESSDIVATFVSQFELIWTRQGSDPFPQPAER